jgi:hypothetical protein
LTACTTTTGRTSWWSAARISTSPTMVLTLRPSSALRTAATSVDFAFWMASFTRMKAR